MKNLRQAEMLQIVMSDEKMRELYCNERVKEGLIWSKAGLKFQGKKIGIQKFGLIEKRIAQHIYNEFNKNRPTSKRRGEQKI